MASLKLFGKQYAQFLNIKSLLTWYLRYLSLKNNLIQSIPYEALRSSAATLETLDLEGNNFTDITFAEDIIFVKNISLNLANNRLTYLEGGAFKSFPHMKDLDISNNFISYVQENFLEGVNHLENLDLSFNKLSHLAGSSLNAISGSLLRLNLEDNTFNVLPRSLRVLVRLERLNLKSNQLFRIEENIFEHLLNLKELVLSENTLTVMPTKIMKYLINLEHLDLSQNQITVLHDRFDRDFKSKVIRLSLASNRILRLSHPASFAGFEHLTHLDLSGNGITHISEDVFVRSTMIESLFLQNNGLDVFPEAQIKKLVRLR